ncbi:hypothetical protein JHK82_022343 [Glycine max]|nr:hypothetical protein JHK82_022343 [Glycine max]
MASDSQMMNLVLRDCNWVLEGLESIVDVGGGTGITLPPNAPEKVGESIAAPVVAAAVEVGMSQRATSRPKKCPPPSITLLEYTWVDREARRNQIVAVSGPLSNLAANPTTGPHEVSANVVPPVDKDPKGKRKHKKQSHREHQRA